MTPGLPSPRSTWVRFTVVAAVVLALALAATVALAWELARLQGRAAVDERLDREREVFAVRAAALLVGSTGPADLKRRFEGYLATQPGSALHMTVIRVDGGPVLTTATGPAPVAVLRDGDRLPAGVPGRVVTRATSEGDVRVLATPVTVDGRRVAVLEVDGWLGGVDHDATTLAGRVALAATLAGVLGVVVLALALRTATRPLRALHAAAERAGIGDLAVRVPDPGGRPDEVGDLARAFNGMLERISAEVAARTALFAAVSHELRTPVAVARGHLELLETGIAADPDASLRLVGAELVRLSRLLDDLLLLAAADGDTFLVPTDVTVDRVVEEVRLRLVGLDLGDVAVEAVGPAGATTVRVDLDRVLQAVLNLVVNARRHTPAGTRVEVRVGVVDGALDVGVADDGPGIPEALRARVFEPFARGGRGSTGLGLAVVRAVATAHGGGVDLDSGPAGTTVRLRFGGPAGQL
ncbi:HAMP domain-containing sensor histidine kinase [Kineosporia sp. A_224]|uniref:sensor histidine kinase n=1 Tax=Kineosporia sp. A_224 TaxID=1962180 RepID=UPI000B4A7B9E|nr:HAMP domain-containing sensor histidine kinase [Kineosporia sp. A_224]